ncbi:hypothetical protein BJV82DRAFT_627692 [Fennellomyces sp. T-0311]|nr:hypothetical protein BJV82DRAFT_627692 [Fennellomyces sp. T-0311]
MAEYYEPPDRGFNRNDGVPEANGRGNSRHSSPHGAHAQINPGNFYHGHERSPSGGYEMPMPMNQHQHVHNYAGGNIGGYPPAPIPQHHQPQPEQWRYSARQPHQMAMPAPQGYPPQPSFPQYPPHSMGPYPPMSGAPQGYPPPYPPRPSPSSSYPSAHRPEPSTSTPAYPPAQEPHSPYPPMRPEPYPPAHQHEPHSPYLPPRPPVQHQEPHSPYPPANTETYPPAQEPHSPYPPTNTEAYPPLHDEEPKSPYPPVRKDGPPSYPPARHEPQPPYPPAHQEPTPPAHQEPYPPVAPYPPRVPLHQENLFPQRAGTAFAFQMPTPERWNRSQTYDQAPPYPPVNYTKHSSQDFISTFRPSTVQPSSAVFADNQHRESVKKSLKRFDSTKHTVSDDSSDDSDAEEQARQQSGYSKPLPPAPEEEADGPVEPETVPAEGSTDPALLSVLSKAFVTKMKETVSLRELSCSTEYPDAFTGAEAVDTVFDLLMGQYPREHCLKVLNAMMQCKPAGLLESVNETSQKSHKRVYDSLDETYRLRPVIPVGVFTGITRCYVRGCEPGYGGCYAPRCPNKPDVYEKDVEPQEQLGRSVSMRSTVYTEGMRSTENWGMRVPREFYDSIDPRERDRQEAINEVIYGEEQYLKDMELLQEAIVAPMSESGAIDPNMWELFARDVFNNHVELQDLSSELFTDLFERQEEYDQDCVPSISDILLKHFERFSEPYSRYVPNVHLAEYIVALTRRSNDRFGQFLQSLQTNPHLKKQEFRHFLLRPVMRLQRYPLLLSAIIKKTDKESEDYAILMQCKEKIANVAALCDSLSASVKKRVEILTLNSALTCRQGETYDLKLTDPQRQIYYRNDLKRENSTLEVSEKYFHVIVFDHMVLLTKPRKTSESTEYKISRRPIPLQMLYIPELNNEFSLPSLLPSRTSTMHSTYNTLRSSTTTRGLSSTLSLTLVHPGRHGGTYYLLCNDANDKKRCLDAIRNAKANLKNRVDAFSLHSIESSLFKYDADASLSDGLGRVTCTVPFVTDDNEKMTAIGTTTGRVYFKPSDGRPARTILNNLKSVAQVGVMQKYQILVVLADKKLYAYPLDALTSPKNLKDPNSLRHEISDPVTFFQVGVCNGADMLVYARQKTVSTIFTALKPTRSIDPSSRGSGSRSYRSFFGSSSRNPWFSTYKEFSVGARATNIHFLKSKFAVVCERAFEIIDPEDLVDGHTIPDEHDPQFDFLEQRRDGLRPVAMYRVQGKFLMCYNKFAFYVNNRNQQLVPRDNTSALLCEWEIHPDHIIFHYPYVLAVDPRFIEIRHVETGDLVQMISGNECRLTYYNGNGNTGEPLIIEGCIVQKNRAQYQNVFRLEINPDVQN